MLQVVLMEIDRRAKPNQALARFSINKPEMLAKVLGEKIPTKRTLIQAKSSFNFKDK